MPHIQADRSKVCVKERVVVRLSCFPKTVGRGKAKVVGPPRQTLSSFQVMDTLTEH